MFFITKYKIQFLILYQFIFTDKKVSKILQRQTLTYYSKIRKICKSCFMQKLVSGKFNLVKTYTQNVQKMKNVL